MKRLLFFFLFIPLLLRATIYDVSIYDIQYVTNPTVNDSSSYAGDTIHTYGIVTGVFDRGHFIQDAYGAWNGVYVYKWGSDTLYEVGDSIEITGTIAEYYGLTEISPISETVLKKGVTIPEPLKLDVGEMSAESLEGVYLQVDTVIVSNDSLGYGEWEITENGEYGRVDDMGTYTYSPTNDDTILILRGLMHYTYSNWKLEPRNDNDIFLSLLNILSVTRTPYSPAPSENVDVSSKVISYYGIDSTYMYYKINSGTWNIAELDSIENNTYYHYTIPGANAGDSIEYYVYFKDNNGDTVLSYLKGYTISAASSATGRILFDYTKNETAGEADWIVDRDYPHPLPTGPSVETDWDGGISAWAFELDTIGYEIWTLSPDSTIKYEQDGDSLDLSMFDVFIVCEPQNPFSTSEKTAVFDYVRDGGGLFMVADHNSSDRDSDGWDSPAIWNDLGAADSFGMYFNVTGDSYNSVSDTAAYIDSTNIVGDTIVNGPYGNVSGGVFCFHLGTTMPTNAKSEIICPIESNLNYSMLSVAQFGNGKVVGMGDSSPADDGTSTSGDDLYDGWNEGVAGKVILNATWWLAQKGSNNALENISFYATKKNNVVYVNANISGTNWLSFRLSRRIGYGTKYELIKTFNTGQISYTDKSYDNIVFYRLEGVKTNGDVILIGFEKVYPNDVRYLRYIPITQVGKDISVLFDADINSQITYTIKDIAGRTVYKGIWNSTKNVIIPGVLRAGKYYLNVEFTDHKEIKPFLIVR